MSLSATTFDDQGKRPLTTLPASPSASPQDPSSEIDESYLSHTDTAPSTSTSIEREFGEEAERPTYDEGVRDELGGDYDYEQVAKDCEDDEGDDGGLPELEDDQLAQSDDVFPEEEEEEEEESEL